MTLATHEKCTALPNVTHSCSSTRATSQLLLLNFDLLFFFASDLDAASFIYHWPRYNVRLLGGKRQGRRQSHIYSNDIARTVSTKKKKSNNVMPVVNFITHTHTHTHTHTQKEP